MLIPHCRFSRIVVVVPQYAFLVINVHLDLSSQKLLCAREIEIGEGRITLDTNEMISFVYKNKKMDDKVEGAPNIDNYFSI